MSWTKAAIRPSGKVLCATTISAIGRGYTWRGEFLPSLRRSVAVSEYLAMHDQYVDSVSRLHFTVGSWVYEYDVSLAVLCGQLEKCQASGGLFHANCLQSPLLDVCLGIPIDCGCRKSLLLDPSDGVFGRFDLAALLRLPHLTAFWLFCKQVDLRLRCVIAGDWLLQ